MKKFITQLIMNQKNLAKATNLKSAIFQVVYQQVLNKLFEI